MSSSSLHYLNLHHHQVPTFSTWKHEKQDDGCFCEDGIPCGGDAFRRACSALRLSPTDGCHTAERGNISGAVWAFQGGRTNLQQQDLQSVYTDSDGHQWEGHDSFNESIPKGQIHIYQDRQHLHLTPMASWVTAQLKRPHYCVCIKPQSKSTVPCRQRRSFRNTVDDVEVLSPCCCLYSVHTEPWRLPTRYGELS